MLISVIIPCFNSERTVGSTIESALSQEAEREIIVINDGSTDGSAAIIESFGNQIRAEHGPNRGVSGARNRGGKIARGEFLQFVDSDDQLIPGTLARRRDALLSSGADAAYTDYQKLLEQRDAAPVLGEVVVAPAALLDEDAEAACADSRFWVPPAAILYRREIVDRIGGWRTGLPVIQDARFLFDAAAQRGKFVRVAGVGALYRVRADSLSRQNRAKFIHDCFVNAEEIGSYWRDKKLLTPRRIETLRAMWRHAAVASLVNASPDFEAARQYYNAIGARDFAIETGWLLRRLMGVNRASSVARLELERRASHRAKAGVHG